MKIYSVGGSVRDMLLGIKSNDNDYVVVGSSPKEMIELGYSPVGKDFPVFLHPETKEEYALARTERSTGEGHGDFECHWENVTIEEDLFRRDLTINAIAQDLETGDLIDPYGGIHDLEERILRPVSIHFKEDPLRVLRAARFLSQLGSFHFSASPELFSVCNDLSKEGLLKSLTQERIWKEMTKALSSENPTVFFEFLLATEALNSIFPELARLHGVSQPEEYHPEGCAWTHVMIVLKKACEATSRLDVRFAALVHDLGKGITPKEMLPHHYGHEETGIPLVKEVCQRLKVPNKLRNLAVVVCEHHQRIHRCEQMNAGKILKLLKNIEAIRNEDFFEGVLIACRADNYGKLSDNYPSELFLKKMREALIAFDVKPIVEKFKGRPSLVENINQAQVKVIKKAKQEYIRNTNE